ncbi:lactoylglutathione lyase [Malassezia furfur]|uniref:Lactoylglutathione lyase n=1 Tax=Malassezia furfur TaxID=55194 RepID=A0ABY8EKL4_MALFU|nr:lactoylglutathione lyase [Malassezia furfur]
MPTTPETASFRLNHTMVRVKDPQKSLDFYQNVLGMTLIDTMKNDSFTLYFLGYEHQTGKRGEREGLLELTHNHGTENDPDFHYHNGNDKPQGYGHIGISVENVEEACARFERLGVRFQKRLTDGKMRSIAFLLDPDNYWVEILPIKF